MQITGENIYSRIGARPVINAAGNTTVWGGSLLSGAVKQAMEDANIGFVEMEELLQKSGDHIARQLGVEAAYITSGCYAALVLSSAACVAGSDPDKGARLPDTTGMKNEVLLARPQRYSYDRSYTICGSTLIEVGTGDGCSLDDYEQVIGPDTAAIAYLVRGEEAAAADGVASLPDVVELAHSHGVPVIADAAAQIYPLDYLRGNAQAADLVCFGGKYMSGPHSTGFVCGKKDLIDAVTLHGFISDRPVGRGFKVDRQEIMGLVAALDAWLTMDHEERLVGYGARFSVIEDGLRGARSVKSTAVVNSNSFWGLGLHVSLDTEALGKTAAEVAAELLDGTPRVRVDAVDDATLQVCVHNLSEAEDQIVASQMANALI